MTADSLAADLPRVLVIQLGGELECAMTRGWIDALRDRANVEIAAHAGFSEIFSQSSNPAGYHPLTRNPLDLVRMRRHLKNQNFDRVLCLNNMLAGRLLATACVANKRIQTQIGPPTLPSEIDAVLAVLFGRLGVTAPDRDQALVLTTHTQEAANDWLTRFGFDNGQCPRIVAPRAATEMILSSEWRMAAAGNAAELPIILLPVGQEIEFIGNLVGNAFFVPASDLALRAALIKRARILHSNDPPSIELARLTNTPVVALQYANA